MNTTRLVCSGLEVSRVCFGCMSFGKSTDERPWVLGLADARPMSRLAREAGINFFDTANVSVVSIWNRQADFRSEVSGSSVSGYAA